MLELGFQVYYVHGARTTDGRPAVFEVKKVFYFQGFFFQPRRRFLSDHKDRWFLGVGIGQVRLTLRQHSVLFQDEPGTVFNKQKVRICAIRDYALGLFCPSSRRVQEGTVDLQKDEVLHVRAHGFYFLNTSCVSPQT